MFKVYRIPLLDLHSSLSTTCAYDNRNGFRITSQNNYIIYIFPNSKTLPRFCMKINELGSTKNNDKNNDNVIL